ncbi:cytochrome c oxidase subunit II [Devosia pacifica]|uniref:Cytochrome c oxidase subunit II n=1 Tax=Devosia pacifica TaxID=1335967 RepID=A0A918SEB8_9HYPH|nr:c-type cytochrome [Devosia pacifica]GHA36093.1 cytochrome c oxidase subunit II [Devosia pacifica]
MSGTLARTGLIVLVALLLAGCTGTQSVLSPGGVEAERVHLLFWIMTIGSGIILALVVVLTGLALFGSQSLRSRFANERFITGLGLFFPVVVLTVLLVYGLFVMRAGAQSQAPEDGQLRVAIEGELWWWRVTYLDGEGNRITSANELHLPVGTPVELALTSDNVIHSFWAPTLAGKLDMIPGRENTLTVTATRAGVTRGQCAEYCGGAHALMAFHVVAHPPQEFEAWLAHAASPAHEPATAQEQHGAELFQQAGCGSCHAVRGTEADGVIGPDLTHVGGRLSLAAATMPNNSQAFSDWIVNNQHIKPENKMPAYEIFTEEQLDDLSIYLDSLE